MRVPLMSPNPGLDTRGKMLAERFVAEFITCFNTDLQYAGSPLVAGTDGGGQAA